MAGYNGYTNYQTWCVNLWLDNDEGSQDYWIERAAEALEDDPDEATYNLAQMLQDEHEAAAESKMQGPSVLSDLLGNALAQVNWHEIAENFIEMAKEQIEEDE